jgi:hypothetical protein
MFKKVKDEKLLKLQDHNMNEALSKITEINPATGEPETFIDEDEIIDILIQLKTSQVEKLGVLIANP